MTRWNHNHYIHTIVIELNLWKHLISVFKYRCFLHFYLLIITISISMTSYLDRKIGERLLTTEESTLKRSMFAKHRWILLYHVFILFLYRTVLYCTVRFCDVWNISFLFILTVDSKQVPPHLFRQYLLLKILS